VAVSVLRDKERRKREK